MFYRCFLVAPVNNKKNEVCIAFHANLVGDRNRIFGMVQTVTLLTAAISLRDLPGSIACCSVMGHLDKKLY